MLKNGKVIYVGLLFGEEGVEMYFYLFGFYFDLNDNFVDFLIVIVGDDLMDFVREFTVSFYYKRNRDEVRKYV